MNTKLSLFAAALVMSFAMVGCKGNGNNPDDLSIGGSGSYTQKNNMYEVTLKNGQKLYLQQVGRSEGGVSKWDDSLTLISYPIYERGDEKWVAGEEPYIYKGDVVVPSSISLDQEWGIAYMNYSFFYCRELTSVELPSTIKCISNIAFGGCSQLKIISFYADKISGHAFYECSSLKTIKSHSLTPPVLVAEYYDDEGYQQQLEWLFYNVPKFDLYVPKASVDAYKKSYWNQYAKNIFPLD